MQELNGDRIKELSIMNFKGSDMIHCRKYAQLFVLVVFTATAFVGFSASTATVGGVIYKYTVASGEATITGATVGSKTAITVPSTLGGCPVTSIGVEAFGVDFNDTVNITSVKIPSCVRSIWSYAFSGCRKLTAVTIPEGVTIIQDGAFRDCSGLKSVVIPSSVTRIGHCVFSGCTALSLSVASGNANYSMKNGLLCDKSLAIVISCPGDPTSVAIPQGVTSIGDYAFNGCRSLASVEMPNGVRSIGGNAFSGCNGLMSVTLPDGVTSIGGYAFGYCNGLSSVQIPTSVISIGYRAFYNCSGLTSVTIPDCVTSIAETFSEAYKTISDVIIGDDRYLIAKELFADCSALKNVYVPFTVARIEDGAIPSRCNVVRQQLVNVIVSAEDQTVVYDGQLHNSGKVTIACDVAGFPIEEVRYNGGENYSVVGEYSHFVNQSDVVCENGEWKYVVCIVVSRANSAMRIVERPVSVTSATATKVYDGKPLMASGVTVGGSGFVACECSVRNTGSRIEVGSSKNWFELDWAEGALPTNYEITKDEGTLTVTPRPVSIVTKSAQKVYDGKPLVAGGVTVGGSGFVAGECSVRNTGSRIEVGSSKNWFELDWAEGSSSANYEISKEEGTLTVLPAEVSSNGEEPWGGDGPRPCVGGEGVHSLYSTESTYDGFGHTIDVETLSKIKLVGGDSPQISYALTSNGVYQTEPIYFTNSCFTSIWYRVESPNHKPYIHEAGISILPRPVCVVSGSAQKNYDGMPLTAHSFSVGGMGFVGDDGVELSYEGAQTWPGSSANDFSYRFKSNTRPENYDVTCESGVLKVGAEGEISIPDGETVIPENAFSGYVGLTQVTIPECVKYVGANAFVGCTSLVRIDFPAGLDVTRAKLNSWGLSDEWIAQYCRIDDYLVAGATLLQYVGDTSVKKLTVPAGIVRIDKRAFASVGGLEEIEFSGTEKYIGEGAFSQDTKLSKVMLHEGIVQIDDEAFFGCTKMENVIIPSSVKSVGARTFKQCTALTSAQISYGVESIGEECFFSDWRIQEVDIPSTVTNIGLNAFGGDSDIRRVKLRADIRPLSQIFSNYKYIREVGVKICDREIVDGCFRDCTELKDVFWEGNCPRLANDGRELYANTWHGDKNETLTTYVEEESTGWDGIEGSDQLPQAWPLVGSCRCSIAHKDLPTYLCQFDSNGGTLGVQDTYQYSERLVKLPPEPVQSGYKFGGWWTQPIGGLRVTENTIFIEGVYTYLWAHWIKGHTVFLDPNGGVIINGFVTYVDESVYGVLPSPVRSGYAFDGWLYDGHKVEPDTIMNTKADHTLLAQWRAAQYKVIYHPNGGVGNLVTEERVYGETEVLRRNAFVRPGYEFIGWSTHESATSAEYKDAEPVASLTVVDGGGIELWAVWKESEAIDPTNVELTFGGDADWFKVHQLVEAQAGGQTVCTPSFWQSGKIADNEKSDLTTKVFGAGKIGFWWRVDCEKVRTYKWDHLAFFVDNVEIVWTNGVTEWAYFEFAVDGSQEHELIWRYQKDVEGSDGEDCGAVCAIVWTPRLETLEDYAGATNMTLRTDGDAGWFGVKDEIHNQSGSVRSGVITDGQVSSLKSAVDGAGVIRFWWKTDCERVRNYPVDRVLFYVDGVEQAWTNGVSGWVQKHFTITGDGPHDVEWRYVKDEEESSGRDCVWVSEIEWEPLRVPVAVVVPAEVTGGKELVVDESWPMSLDAQFGVGTSAAFVEKFGSDLSAALLKPTGKKNAVGEDMYIWQDYVAGTDPTDPKSQFTAKIEMVDGDPVVIWSPKLSEAEAAKRIYTTYGKKTLEAGEPWTPVETPAQGGWRFFKVGVEMR